MKAVDALYAELWVSLASLLRSYTAAHGLNGNRQATVELGEDRIVVRHGGCWLDLQRQGSIVVWARENGSGGRLELTDAGQLRSFHPRSENTDLGHPGVVREVNGDLGHPDSSGVEEEMDMVAEAWARELMR